MKYFAICPVCGKRLCKAEEGSTVDVKPTGNGSGKGGK